MSHIKWQADLEVNFVMIFLIKNSNLKSLAKHRVRSIMICTGAIQGKSTRSGYAIKRQVIVRVLNLQSSDRFKCHIEAFLTSRDNLCFRADFKKIITTPSFHPCSTLKKWHSKWSYLPGRVSMLTLTLACPC